MRTARGKFRSALAKTEEVNGLTEAAACALRQVGTSRTLAAMPVNPGHLAALTNGASAESIILSLTYLSRLSSSL